MISCVTPLMTMVSHSSKKCCRCAFAFSLGKPQNWFACTMVMRLMRSSKFLAPILTAGPIGMLATVGTEYSCSVLSVMVFGTDDARVTDSVVGGVVEGGSTRGQVFFRNDSGFSMKFVGKLKPSYTILFSSTTGENKQSYPIMSNGYYTCILS